MRAFASLPILLFLLLTVPACEGPPAEEVPDDEVDSEEFAPVIDPATVDFADELDVDLEQMDSTPSGVRYRDDVVGEGEPVEEGDVATVHYTGHLADGTVFESSRESGEPYDVEIGSGQVFVGLDEGIRGMRPGGVRTLVIPPHLAFGTAGAGTTVPPNATLVLEVELLEGA